jgi:hypothetical protein
METHEMIQRLATTGMPVRPLPAPWIRMAFWFAISLPYVAAVVLAGPMKVDLSQAFSDNRFLVEQAATLATALTAAMAAFCSVIPGYGRKILFLPLVPLAVSLATVGEGCLRDWLGFGAVGLNLRPDWGCLPPAILVGIFPAIVMVVMLRRGAPLVPRSTVALAALAVGSLGNFGLRLFHLGDASIMVLFWHVGSMLLLSAFAACLGRQILHWRHVTVHRPR